jgi:hypothetical protein
LVSTTFRQREIKEKVLHLPNTLIGSNPLFQGREDERVFIKCPSKN